MNRCPWCLNDPLNMDYHDKEWGKPVHEDRTHFEFLCLELMQSGLSWLTILKRREGFKTAFHHFDPTLVAKMTEEDVERLLKDPTIIRHRKKIESIIHNASCFLKLKEDYGSFDHFIWSYVEGQPLDMKVDELSQLPSKTPLSEVISQVLKKRGFKFLGPTTVYSYMQAVGIVNDHLNSCSFK